MSGPAFDQILRRLTEAEVEFVVVGGLALGAWGVVRGTKDVDIVAAPDPENLKQVAAVAVAIHGHVQAGESFFSSHLSIAGQLASGEQVAIETDLGRLDVVQGLDGVPDYEDLRLRSVETEILGVKVAVCSVEDLPPKRRGEGGVLGSVERNAPHDAWARIRFDYARLALIGAAKTARCPKETFRPTFSVASLSWLEEHGEVAGNEELMAVQDQDSFRRAQAELEPKEDLAPYMGKWVALRNGKVVASDLSAKGLRNQPEVRPTDAIVPVPRSRPGYFIARVPWSVRGASPLRTDQAPMGS